uniref:exosome complex component CSL4 isoform X2 n=1 Tax=Myxine glutinosa TaxID=7769 RepID=UPI00358FBD34
MTVPKVCVPGERLCSVEECAPGPGTSVRLGYVFATLAGYVRRTDESSSTGLPVIEVVCDTRARLVPEIGTVITGKIMSITPKLARCEIVFIESTPLKDVFRGIIRKEDVRATEKDKVEIYKSFRPGDMILARVISLGDSQSYLLSTAENELGVVVARSEAGGHMVPISWCEMQCPKSHVKELRKVARVQPQFLQT